MRKVKWIIIKYNFILTIYKYFGYLNKLVQQEESMINKRDKLNEIHPSSIELYGLELATKVADYLEVNGEIIPNKHRDFCGTCYYYYKGKYGFCHVYDGFPSVDYPIKEFSDKQSFINWLAGKNDCNMNGSDSNDLETFEKDTFHQGNQRCLKSHLEYYLKKQNNNKI